MISTAQAPVQTNTGYAPVNGLKLYYEIHGEGTPLLLLHGSFMTGAMTFGSLIPELAKHHKVIVVDMQGHGHTGDISRDFSFPHFAEDAAALLQYLHIQQADVVGYSLGATVGLELAILYPEKVRKLVFISSAYNNKGWIPSTKEAFASLTPEMLTNTPLKAAYDAVAPDTAHWHTFLQRMISFEQKPFDLGKENLKKVKAPVLIIKGDNDGIDYTHMAEMYTMLGGGVFGDMVPMPASQLAILPAASHTGIIMMSDKLLSLITPFLQ